MGRPRKAIPAKSKRSASTSDDNERPVEAPASKRTKKTGTSMELSKVHNVHDFLDEDGKEFTLSLLNWYHDNKRDLPWRNLSASLSPTDRAYSVLVSEVMLQQTQVATVIPYYTKWMARWPTFRHLAQASLNDVNEVWAGMGYYSRAKRLWEAAKKVDEELDNEVPLNSRELQEKLPGVGRYTAGAVASIAFGERAAAVDGNVIRVLSRVRCIGADPSTKAASDHIWKLSDELVPTNEPGNYNQAMMDLGATICTPKKPSCKNCPVSHVCMAYQKVQKTNPLKELQRQASEPPIQDIEDTCCSLCLKQPWDSELGVMNFPQKAKKAAPRKEVTLVCVVHASINGTEKYILSKRPQGGLLAGLWEFPSLVFEGNREDGKKEEKVALEMTLLQKHWRANKNLNKPNFVAEVPHIFSHIHQLYVVYSLKVTDEHDVSNVSEQETAWMTAEEILSSAISTAMKKVFTAFSSSHKKEVNPTKRGRSGSKKAETVAPSRKVSDFFKKVEK